MATSFPSWIFDETPIADPFGRGQKAVDILRMFQHPKSRAPGRAFELPRWQERIVRKIYGPCHPDGRRIARTVVILLPRGNRKTSLGAALALLHTIGPERLDGGQVLCSASDRKQARIAYDEAVGIIRQTPRVAAALSFQDYRNRIVHPKSGCVLEAISADAGTQHGRTPTFALVDELHAWKSRELWDVIRTGLVKVPGALLVVISTAGRGQENIAFDVVDYARKVQRGEVDDPATLPIIFEASRDADWRDEAVWRDVNPGLADGFPDIEGLRQLAREAAERPGDREAFKQLHLNVWLDHSADPFVDMATFDEGGGAIDREALAGEACWIGVDMSTINDLTAVVACVRDAKDRLTLFPQFFCPEADLRRRSERDGVPYVRWSEDGFIVPTPGDVIDYATVERHIRDLCDEFDVREIAFDPAYSQPVMGPLAEDGLPTVVVRQGWVTQSPALNELERVIIGRNLRHGGHPVLRWCFSNVAIQTDSAGNRTMHKGKSTDRIDGASATWMAVARACAGNSNASIYDTSRWSEDMAYF